MRTIRGLQITSIVVLSPVLLLLISLIWMLCISIFKHIISTPSSTDMIQQQQRSFNHHKHHIKRSRFFTKLRQSAITPCVIILLYAFYILFKKQKRQVLEPSILIEPEIKTTKKHSKRRKVLKKKKRLDLNVAPKGNHTHHHHHQQQQQQQQQQQIQKEQQPIQQQQKKEQHQQPTMLDSPTPSCTTLKFDNTKIDLNLLSPESTPLHSEDEEEEEQKRTEKNWYSPFMTGLDLDIIPKFSQDHHAPIFFTTDHFQKTTNKTTLIPSLLRDTNIQLLESHPYIPSHLHYHHHHHHHHHAFGSIGDKRKKSSLHI